MDPKMKFVKTKKTSKKKKKKKKLVRLGLCRRRRQKQNLNLESGCDDIINKKLLLYKLKPLSVEEFERFNKNISKNMPWR